MPPAPKKGFGQRRTAFPVLVKSKLEWKSIPRTWNTECKIVWGPISAQFFSIFRHHLLCFFFICFCSVPSSGSTRFSGMLNYCISKEAKLLLPGESTLSNSVSTIHTLKLSIFPALPTDMTPTHDDPSLALLQKETEEQQNEKKVANRIRKECPQLPRKGLGNVGQHSQF